MIPPDSFVMIKKRRAPGKQEQGIEGPYVLVGYTADGTRARIRDKAGREWGEKSSNLSRAEVPPNRYAPAPAEPDAPDADGPPADNQEDQALAAAPAPPPAAATPPAPRLPIPELPPVEPVPLSQPRRRPPRAPAVLPDLPDLGLPEPSSEEPEEPAPSRARTRGRRPNYEKMVNQQLFPGDEDELDF